MANHGSIKRPRILVLGLDWRPYEIRSVQKTFPDLFLGKLLALDMWKTPYDFSAWEKDNSGWEHWKLFSEQLLAMTPQERGLEWEFFHLADATKTPVAYPQICVVSHKQGKWRRRRCVCPDDSSIFLRDCFNCAYCGRPVTVNKKNENFLADTATIDHIIPLSRWDKWASNNTPPWNKESWQNKCCACYECNHRKGNHLNDEIDYKLRIKPYMPSWSLHQNVRVMKGHIKQSWVEHLYPDSIKVI